MNANIERALDRARRAAKRDPIIAKTFATWLRKYDHSTRPLGMGDPDEATFLRTTPPPATRAAAARLENRWERESRNVWRDLQETIKREHRKDASWERRMLRPGAELRSRHVPRKRRPKPFQKKLRANVEHEAGAFAVFFGDTVRDEFADSVAARILARVGEILTKRFAAKKAS